jgi:hypothetical protein
MTDPDLQEALDEAINYIAVWAVIKGDEKASALLNKCTAALANSRARIDAGRHWRHVTSGMFVTEIGRGRMQTAEPIGDMTPIVIYHHAGENGGGTVWARPTREFEDGRFVAFASVP